VKGRAKTEFIECRGRDGVIPGDHRALPVPVLDPLEGKRHVGDRESDQPPAIAREDLVAAGGVVIPSQVKVIVMGHAGVAGKVGRPVGAQRARSSGIRQWIGVALNILRDFADAVGGDNAPGEWLAGGGIKPGVTLGETDDFGFHVVKDKVQVHDLHATLLHLLGFDHTKLTYRFQGRDFRLTDVEGELVPQLMA